MENWKSVPGYENYYKVSDQGRVMSMARTITKKDGTTQSYDDRVLAPWTHKSGHLYVSLHKGKGKKSHQVHRLVLAAFIGSCPDGMEVCHADGVASNNNLANLRYGTRKENVADAVSSGSMLRGSANGHAKLTETDIPRIFALYAAGETQKQIAARFGVGFGAIQKVLDRTRWAHVNVE